MHIRIRNLLLICSLICAVPSLNAIKPEYEKLSENEIIQKANNGDFDAIDCLVAGWDKVRVRKPYKDVYKSEYGLQPASFKAFLSNPEMLDKVAIDQAYSKYFFFFREMTFRDIQEKRNERAKERQRKKSYNSWHKKSDTSNDDADNDEFDDCNPSEEDELLDLLADFTTKVCQKIMSNILEKQKVSVDHLLDLHLSGLDFQGKKWPEELRIDSSSVEQSMVSLSSVYLFMQLDLGNNPPESLYAEFFTPKENIASEVAKFLFKNHLLYYNWVYKHYRLGHQWAKEHSKKLLTDPDAIFGANPQSLYPLCETILKDKDPLWLQILAEKLSNLCNRGFFKNVVDEKMAAYGIQANLMLWESEENIPDDLEMPFLSFVGGATIEQKLKLWNLVKAQNEKGRKNCDLELAFFSAAGFAGSVDFVAAEKYFQKLSASKPLPPQFAEYVLGLSFAEDQSTGECIYKICEKRQQQVDATLNDPLPDFAMGLVLTKGWGQPEDKQRGLMHLLKSARSGCLKAAIQVISMDTDNATELEMGLLLAHELPKDIFVEIIAKNIKYSEEYVEDKKVQAAAKKLRPLTEKIRQILAQFNAIDPSSQPEIKKTGVAHLDKSSQIVKTLESGLRELGSRLYKEMDNVGKSKAGFFLTKIKAEHKIPGNLETVKYDSEKYTSMGRPQIALSQELVKLLEDFDTNQAQLRSLASFFEEAVKMVNAEIFANGNDEPESENYKTLCARAVEIQSHFERIDTLLSLLAQIKTWVTEQSDSRKYLYYCCLGGVDINDDNSDESSEKEQADDDDDSSN